MPCGGEEQGLHLPPVPEAVSLRLRQPIRLIRRATGTDGGCSMDRIKIADEVNRDRRRFFGAAAMAVASTQLGIITPAAAQRMEGKMPAIKPGTNKSFGPLKQIDAGLLNVGYAEAGPTDGPVVILRSEEHT